MGGGGGGGAFKTVLVSAVVFRIPCSVTLEFRFP